MSVMLLTRVKLLTEQGKRDNLESDGASLLKVLVNNCMETLSKSLINTAKTDSSVIARPKTPAKSILRNLQKTDRNLYPIYDGGKNVTPKPLNPLSFKEGKERQISSLNIVKESSDTNADYSSALFVSQLYQSSRYSTEYHQFQSYYEGGTFQSTFQSGGETISSFFETKPPPEKPKPMPPKISLLLVETPTFFLFELASKTVDKESEEGVETDKDNKNYEFITVGKGRNRKVVNAEVQTYAILSKSRETEAEKVRMRNDYAYASGWDMFDTYSNMDGEEHIAPVEFRDSHVSIDSVQVPTEDKQMIKIVRSPRFLDSLIVIERLLANNNYNKQQQIFRGLLEPDPFREDIEYNYQLNLLWTFANERTKGRCVTAICWNTMNEDVLAVGYGKFYYAEETNGMIMIWNIKNPVQPERVYHFASPVTSVDFSKQHPNLLAIGFYDGSIKVIDISDTKVRFIGMSSREDSPLFEPIWRVEWYTDDDYYKGMEFLMATSQDGRISRFNLENASTMPYFHLMRVSRAEGKLKGLKVPSKCVVPGIPIARHPGALVLTQHPADSNIYYVGTTEGVVHKCSKNYYHQHLDLFLAHEGPIYQIKFSPFCNKLFLTCGDDWAVRIWADGISEPLMELSKTMQTIQSADWSPSYSTVIANVSGTDIFIWDLQRKAYAPQSITRSPSKCRSTIVQFTSNGRCLLVGDIEGNVHIFSLEEMPFPAFYQGDLVTQALKRELVIKPDLLRKIEKLEGLSFDKTKFKKHFR